MRCTALIMSWVITVIIQWILYNSQVGQQFSQQSTYYRSCTYALQIIARIFRTKWMPSLHYTFRDEQFVEKIFWWTLKFSFKRLYCHENIAAGCYCHPWFVRVKNFLSMTFPPTVFLIYHHEREREQILETKYFSVCVRHQTNQKAL